MRSLYEKLNRLDDSLVESTKVVKKKKLTESVEDDKKKLFDAAASVKCKLDDDTIEYAMYDVDDFIENELVYCGKLLMSECPDMMFWKYGSDSDFGSYCEVYISDDEYPDEYYQISHDRVYNITDEMNGEYDYDDDIDEMLTESMDPSNALKIREESDADVVFYGYQYKNEEPVEITPEELSETEYENRVDQIVNDYTKISDRGTSGNRYGHHRDFIFYALYKD